MKKSSLELVSIYITDSNSNTFAADGKELVSIAYRYRRWKLDDDLHLVTHCEVHTVTEVRELKNNANKLAKWTARAFLASANLMKIGYVSRVHPRDHYNHVILSMIGYKPWDFAAQINLNVANMWGIVKSIVDLGAVIFDIEYAQWLDEHNRLISELRSAVNSHASDNNLRSIVDGIMAHYDDIFKLKSAAAKADVFHLLSGMWKTPAERCFQWLGGFRSSELLKLLTRQLEPLTEQQLAGICNLQQSSQQAEDALSQGMEALQQSLAETLAGSLGPSGPSGNVANYMGQMAMAMGKLGTLKNFIRQADNLRQQTLQQMHRILTTCQFARALLAINDYFSRLQALSSLGLARPKE
ncbi:transcription factor TGA2.2-like [Dioscorea cayenensis subsp. rotundata]|uniref:Transcription factor TGA2.2-like n=1 Tax=Dioscorea cayennensis subsp. rotundata TaxID=55577 RepID=A0AB40BNE7_DIOCR|nr:transcription factor TGA2.2-like [Dioscorea cayenensis subsp. rotundata]